MLYVCYKSCLTLGVLLNPSKPWIFFSYKIGKFRVRTSIQALFMSP